MKRICMILMAVIVSASLLALGCSAGYVAKYDAKTFWFSGNQVFGYMYTTGSYSLAERIPDTSIIDYTAELKPYVDWQSVTQGYISSKYAYIQQRLTAYDSSTAYGVKVRLMDTWTFIKGRTYEWVMLLDNLQFYNGETKISGDPRLQSIILTTTTGTVTVTLTQKTLYGTDGGYIAAFAYLCQVTPTDNITVTEINFTWKNNSHASYKATSAAIGFGYSDCVSYTGSLEDVVVNPVLDDMNKQLEEIKQGQDDIKDILTQPIERPSGDTFVDPIDDVDGDIDTKGKGILDSLIEALEAIPQAGASFWKNIYATLISFSIFTPFVSLGIGFILMRMLLGR